MNESLEKFGFRAVHIIINSLGIEDLERWETKIRQALFRKKKIDFHFASYLNWQTAPAYWGNFTSPWRPSKDDLGNYARAFSGLNKNSRVLILGATPELRNLVVSSGCKAVIVDFSFQMIVDMLRYAQEVGINDEVWMKSDWLDMPLEGGFDVIVGDLVLRMIEKDRQREFLGKIRRILSPHGIFATRVHFVDESLSALGRDKILDAAAAAADEHLAVCVISGRIFDKFSDLGANVIYRKEAFEFVRSALGNARDPEKRNILLKIMKFISGGIEWQLIPRKIGWTANSKAQLDGLIGEFFDTADVRKAKDYPDSEFYPVYFLRPLPRFHYQDAD